MGSKKPEGQSELLPPEAPEAEPESQKPQFGEHDGLCHYEWRGRRCPLPGNSTASMGQRGVFYCLFHYNADNRRGGFIQDDHFDRFCDPENGEACVKDWIEIHYCGRPQDDLAQLLKDHEEWQREAGEAKSTYVSRMQATIARLTGVKTLRTEASDGA